MMRFQHDDAGVSRWPMYLSTSVVIAVVLAGLAAVAALTIAIRGQVPLEMAPPQVREDVSHVEAQVFARETAAERSARQARARLYSYGWVDRQRGIVHVPVEAAMRLYLDERKKQP